MENINGTPIQYPKRENAQGTMRQASRQNSSPNAMPAANEKIDELRHLYPTIKDFMLANSPDRQLEICNNSDKCHFGNSPTLSQLNACYGDAAAEAWLVPQLYELGDFEGLKGQADRHQLAKTAKIIATEFYYLKTDELLLFFYRFCAGRYGQFYSYFTPSVVIRSLRDFLKECSRAFEQYEQAVRERMWQEAKSKAVTYEEYLRNK